MSPTYPVVAAIDFGTHGTGYAWTEVQDDLAETMRRQPIYRENWPGTPNLYPKDLSAVLLGPGGDVTAWGHEAKQEWSRLNASEQGAGHGYVSGFKMALKADAYRGVAAPGAGSVVIDSVTKAYPLVVSYLQRMYQLALAEIQGSGYLEKQIRWCITVPAIWDEEEKQLMRRAAAEAGMPDERDRLLLALEPEAAAVYCRVHLARVLGSQQEERAQLVSAGARFMVVDCGGGTVDITAFRVEADSGGRDRMVEIGRVSGGKLGSEYINEAFIEQILRDRFGGAQVIELIRRECPLALLDLVDSWEGQKVTARVRRDGTTGEPQFERPVYLPIPGEIRDLLTPEVVQRLAAVPGSGAGHRIVLAPEEVSRLFEGVIGHLIELVDEELDHIAADNGAPNGPEQILLVGGLAASEYLQERLLRHFGGRVRLVLPARPSAAVLLGAVMYGCDPPMVWKRRSRYTYGCNFAPPYDDVHDQGREPLTTDDGVKRCDGRFSVFVTVGQTIAADQVETNTYVPLYETQESVFFSFYRSTSPSPRYVDDPGCERVGSLSVNLGDGMRLPFGQRGVSVEMRFGDTDVSVAGTNNHNGQPVRTTLRFDSGL